MSIRKKAAIRATMATGAWALLMLIPVVSAITLIAFMIPLWTLSNIGVPALGRELNGFFVPSAIGWSLIAGFVWLSLFWLFHRRLKKVSPAGTA